MTNQKRTRIDKRVRLALTLMIENGLCRKDAAQQAKICDNSLYKALRRPDVAALRTELLGVLRKSEAARTIKRVSDLADGSKSDAVRLDANMWLADVAGEGPVQRSHSIHEHVGNVIPGLQIVFTPWRPHDVGDGVVIDQPQPTIQRIGTPVPYPDAGRFVGTPVAHPSMVNKGRRD